MQRLIDAFHLEQSLPTSSPADNNHVMTRHFAVESFRALIKAEPTVTPPPVYSQAILLNQAVRCALQYAFPKAIMNLRLELIVYPVLRIESIENWKGGNIPAERLRCETCLYWEDFNGVCFCGESPYCADFTDGDDGCCYWQQKEPVTQSPADTEGTE